MIKFKKLAVLLSAALMLTACASATDPQAASAQTAEAAAQETENGAPLEGAADGQESSAQAAPGGTTQAQAEKAEETVTIVIPTVYESVKTQEEADSIKEQNGYESAVLGEDGSLTVVMSRSRHEELISRFRESVDKAVSEIVSADDGSTIEKIEYNDDYSVFTVTVSGDEIGTVERQTADELVMYGTLYHIYSGSNVDHITVDYVSSGSGEVIESADSGSLDSAY